MLVSRKLFLSIDLKKLGDVVSKEVVKNSVQQTKCESK